MHTHECLKLEKETKTTLKMEKLKIKLEDDKTSVKMPIKIFYKCMSLNITVLNNSNK